MIAIETLKIRLTLDSYEIEPETPETIEDGYRLYAWTGRLEITLTSTQELKRVRVIYATSKGGICGLPQTLQAYGTIRHSFDLGPPPGEIRISWGSIESPRKVTIVLAEVAQTRIEATPS
jgi:hypothetical protein